MTPGSAPLVSVVTPCYNAAAFVAETLAAVRAQTYPAVEHVVVDDGSTDASWDVVRAHGSAVTCVRLPRNRGGSHARNHGAHLARGAFLMFLDADDLLAPDAIEAMVAAVRDRPGSVAVCPWQRLRRVAGRWVPQPAEIPFPPPPDALRGWLEGIWVPPCAVLWRRDAYAPTGGWDERLTLNDDGDLMMRALAGGVRLVPTTAGAAYYRDHGTERLSVSGSVYSELKLRSQLAIHEKLTAQLAALGRLADYAAPIGVGYHRIAVLGFQVGYPDLAREALRRGERLAGRRALARTPLGRLLVWTLGLERKERVAGALARWGIMTRERRTTVQRRRLHAGRAAGSG